MHMQSCYFANLNLLLPCRSGCPPPLFDNGDANWNVAENSLRNLSNFFVIHQFQVAPDQLELKAGEDRIRIQLSLSYFNVVVVQDCKDTY